METISIRINKNTWRMLKRLKADSMDTISYDEIISSLILKNE